MVSSFHFSSQANMLGTSQRLPPVIAIAYFISADFKCIDMRRKNNNKNTFEKKTNYDTPRDIEQDEMTTAILCIGNQNINFTSQLRCSYLSIQSPCKWQKDACS